MNSERGQHERLATGESKQEMVELDSGRLIDENLNCKSSQIWVFKRRNKFCTPNLDFYGKNDFSYIKN